VSKSAATVLRSNVTASAKGSRPGVDQVLGR
jgi:hypothetical protein